MIYGYIRVSSDKQTVENQRFEISNFCKHQNLSIDDWIEETISGTKNYSKRELGRLLKKVRKDDIIICSELSRLGRNLFMIMEILNICMSKECRVWTIKDNYRLGDDIQSKVLAFAFGLSAEIERNLISQRTKEALARKKAEGIVLGRRKGSKNKKNKLDNKEMLIKKSLERGISKTDLAHKLKVSRNTLYLFLQRTNLSEEIRIQETSQKDLSNLGAQVSTAINLLNNFMNEIGDNDLYVKVAHLKTLVERGVITYIAKRLQRIQKNLRRTGGKARMTHDEAFSEIITMAQKYAPYYIAEETMLNQQETDAEIILSESFQ